MELNMILKMLPVEIILTLELITNQNVMKGLCFEFLSRILTCILTLRRRIMLIYVFQLLFGFAKFWNTYCGFGKLGLSSSDCALNFKQNQA